MIIVKILGIWGAVSILFAAACCAVLQRNKGAGMNSLKTILVAYQNGERGLPNYHELAAMVEHSGEPKVFLFQHDETGRTMCVDAWQIENGFEKHNPRLHKIGELFARPPAQPDTEALKARIAELDSMVDKEITLRDNYHEWADRLANAVAEHFNVDIGEHSNINNPWAEALDVVENAPDHIAVQAGQEPVGEWQDISTLPYADDYVWLKHGDTIDGPRSMVTDDYDRYSEWSPCEPPRDNVAPPAPANAMTIVQLLLDWVDSRIDAEVTHRPDVNIYKATIHQTWMQMRRKLLELKGDGSAILPQSVIDSMEGK